MPAQISMDSIVETALTGVSKAQKKYVEWSGGQWLWQAPEYILTTYVAEELGKLTGAKYITLENGAKSALTDAGAAGKGRLHSAIRVNGRFDILFWWGDDRPRAVIELKNQISNIDAETKKDLKRISEVLKRKSEDSSFQFGLSVFYTSAKNNSTFLAKEIIEKRLKNIVNEAREILPKNTIKLYSKKVCTEDDSAWVSAALLIR